MKMKNTKIKFAIEVGELKRTMALELVPMDEEKCQPIIEMELSSGFKTRTTLPPIDYKYLNEKLARLAVSTDYKSVEFLAKKVLFFLTLEG